MDYSLRVIITNMTKAMGAKLKLEISHVYLALRKVQHSQQMKCGLGTFCDSMLGVKAAGRNNLHHCHILTPKSHY